MLILGMITYRMSCKPNKLEKHFLWTPCSGSVTPVSEMVKIGIDLGLRPRFLVNQIFQQKSSNFTSANLKAGNNNILFSNFRYVS